MPLGTHRTPKPSKPRARNLLNPEQCLGSGTRFLPETAPARPERTEIYIVQRPQSILPLGEKKKPPKNWMFQSKFRSQKTTSRIPPPRQPKKKKREKPWSSRELLNNQHPNARDFVERLCRCHELFAT